MDNCFENNHGFDIPGKRVTRLLEIKVPYVLRHVELNKGIQIINLQSRFYKILQTQTQVYITRIFNFICKYRVLMHAHC